MTTLNDLKRTSRTKRYADGHQKLLGTHLGKSHRVPPAPSEIARWRKTGSGKGPAISHRRVRNGKRFARLMREGWFK